MDLDKVNALIQQASDTIACDANCQKDKKTGDLKQIFLDAQSNVQNAPLKLNEAAKNYYVFSSGESGYNEYLDKDLSAKANKITTDIENNFNANVMQVTKSINMLDGISLNRQNIIDLLQTFEDENDKLNEQIENTENKTLTNDRKMYYEEEGISGLTFYYNVMMFFYVSIIIVFCVLMITNQSTYNVGQKLFILLFLVLYPYFSSRVFNWILKTLEAIKNMLPRNTRLD
jgi:hypothetical protein